MRKNSTPEFFFTLVDREEIFYLMMHSIYLILELSSVRHIVMDHSGKCMSNSFQLTRDLYTHHSTSIILFVTAFVIPVVDNWQVQNCTYKTAIVNFFNLLQHSGKLI